MTTKTTTHTTTDPTAPVVRGTYRAEELIQSILTALVELQGRESLSPDDLATLKGIDEELWGLIGWNRYLESERR